MTRRFANGDLWIDKTTLSYWRWWDGRWVFQGNLREAGAA